VRQIRVGRNNPSSASTTSSSTATSSRSAQWQASDVPLYATCNVPAVFENAYSSGDQGCFREWGYKETGVGAPNEFVLPFLGVEWQNHVELNTPGHYSVQTRAQLPGSGYVKDLANSKSEALVDLEVPVLSCFCLIVLLVLLVFPCWLLLFSCSRLFFLIFVMVFVREITPGFLTIVYFNLYSPSPSPSPSFAVANP